MHITQLNRVLTHSVCGYGDSTITPVFTFVICKINDPVYVHAREISTLFGGVAELVF